MIKLTGARIIDPAHDVNESVRDLFMRDGRIVDAPANGERIELDGLFGMGEDFYLKC